METAELKNLIAEMKNSWKGLTCKSELAEENKYTNKFEID